VTAVPAEPSGPRPARQRLSEDERRAQILRAAVVVVARHGFEGGSTSLIAAQAGVSKGLIWHYFTDKTDLMRQVVIATMRVITQDVTAGLDEATPPPDLIRLSIRRLAGLSVTHRDELTAINEIVRNLRAPDGAHAFSLADYEEYYQGQEALFRRGQREGLFRPFDTRVMAVTYQGAIDTMLGYFESHPGIDTERYASELADILLGAMMAAPAGQR
jgi:AcrR family transcriptional regulator